MDKIKIVVLVLVGGILLMSNARGQKQETEKELTTLKLVQQLYDAEKVKSGENYFTILIKTNTDDRFYILKVRADIFSSREEKLD